MNKLSNSVIYIYAGQASRYIKADERLLWWGRPDARQFAAHYVVQLLVAVLFAGIGFWVTINARLRHQVFGTADPLSAYLGFGAFLAAGIGGLIGTYLMLRTISSRHDVAYPLTDRRLIIATGRWKPKSFGDRHLDDSRWKTVTTMGVLVHAHP